MSYFVYNIDNHTKGRPLCVSTFMKKLAIVFLSLLLAAVTVGSSLLTVLSVPKADEEIWDTSSYRLEALAEKTYNTTEPFAILITPPRTRRSLCTPSASTRG